MIRPTFLAFETAKRALTVNQVGLNTVGHNISNVSTPGYTRQRVDQVALSISGYQSKYRAFGTNFSGQGVLATGISQVRDPYLDARYRNEASNYGAISTRSNGLTSIEDILDEISTNQGIGDMLENFLEKLNLYNQSTIDADLASIVRTSAKQLTQIMNQTANQLQNALTQQIEDLNIGVTNDLNSALQQIASLNEIIRQEHIYGNPANELMDQRNLLIDQLSEYCNIKVINTPEKVSNNLTISNLSIVMVDTTVIPAQEVMLVDNNDYNGFRVNQTADGGVSISLVDGNSGGVLKQDVTDNITSGILRGHLDIINGKGEFAASGENNYRGIPYYMKSLDALAAKFAEEMNRINSISKEEADEPNAIGPQQDKPLFMAKGGGQVTAANIAISTQWDDNVNYLTHTKKIQDGSVNEEDDQDETIYDGDGNPVENVTQSSENINKFIEALKGKMYFTAQNGDGKTFTLFSGSPSEFLANMQSELGLDKSLQTTLLGASELVVTGYGDQRNDLSSVNIDEEAINMMTYQNYYNAAARYMTVIDEALGTIIQGMGVVGR